MTNLLGNLVKLAPYIEKLGAFIDKKIMASKQEKEAVEKVFRGTVNEIYGNLSILKQLNYNAVKTQTINSRQIKNILADLKTANLEQFFWYARKSPQMKKKDSRNLLDKMSLALHKINDLHKYAGKTAKQLEMLKGFRPAVRLNNIRKTYADIVGIIKK
jgi:hypothetical protein